MADISDPERFSGQLPSDLDQQAFNFLERFNNFNILFCSAFVMGKMFPCSLDRKSLLFDEVIDQPEIVNIPGGKDPVSLLVLLGVNDWKFLFPEPDQ